MFSVTFRSSHAIAPTDLSCINALYALWLKANNYFPLIRGSVKFEQIVTLLQSGSYAEIVANKVLMVSFEKFPRLDVSGYDSLYGKGAAQQALLEYSEVATKDRIDAYDRIQFQDLCSPHSALLLQKQKEHCLEEKSAKPKPTTLVIPDKKQGSLITLRLLRSEPLPKREIVTPSPTATQVAASTPAQENHFRWPTPQVPPNTPNP